MRRADHLYRKYKDGANNPEDKFELFEQLDLVGNIQNE